MMGFLKKLFGTNQPTWEEADVSTLSLASEVTGNYSSDLLKREDVYALIVVVPHGSIANKTEEERQDYVWQIYRASNPKMYEAIKDDPEVRTYCYESSHMHPGKIMSDTHWFDAWEHFGLPAEYSAVLQFLSIKEDRLRFRLYDPNQKMECQPVDVLVEPAVWPAIIDGPRDMTLLTAFKTNEALSLPTSCILRPKE